jgi:Zn-dependent protease
VAAQADGGGLRLLREFRLGRALGVDVAVHASAIIALPLVAWAVAAIVGAARSDWSEPHGWAIGAAAALLFVVALLIHAAAQASVARRFGSRLTGVTLFVFGGGARFDHPPSDARQQLWLGVAGPVASVVVAAACGFVWVVTRNGNGSIAALAGAAGVLNGALSAVRLLPSLSLDGGRFFHGLVWALRGNHLLATRASVWFAGWMPLALAIAGAVTVLFLVIPGLYLMAAGLLLGGDRSIWGVRVRGADDAPDAPTRRGPRLIICGSGRSGTSAVARVLHEAGLTAGHQLIAADEHNVEGYFEERAVVEVNEAIFQAAGLSDDRAAPTRDQVIEAARPLMGYMAAVAADATPTWKDPRFTWTLEAWLRVFDTKPAIIVCLRSPLEVADSTLRYFGLEDEERRRRIAQYWRAQYERLLDVIETLGLDAIAVEYGELHREPSRSIERLAGFVGRQLDATLVRQDLRHHQLPIPDEFRELYDRVQQVGTTTN